MHEQQRRGTRLLTSWRGTTDRKENTVATKCEICGKTKSFGHNVSFSKRRTNRDFKANIQHKRIIIDGTIRRVNVCTRCIRTAGKAGRMA
jgi:large subunit ribosomal protein L28